MKAIRLHRYGGPEVLSFEDAPLPEPGPEELLVRVHAAGVNPIDWKVREGYLKTALHGAFPRIPGWDLAGVVVGLGRGVVGFRPGEQVFGRLEVGRSGAYAEFALARANEVVRMPRGLDFIRAGAIPIAGLTAWQALFGANGAMDSIGLTKNDRLLVYGATGGVGHLAVQLAKRHGARVIATGSKPHVGALTELGADRVLDPAVESIDVAGEVDAVLDLVGGEAQARALEVLRPGGVLASTVAPPPATSTEAKGVRPVMVMSRMIGQQLATLGELFEDGRLQVIVSEVLPLADAARALELSRSGHVLGKIVLEVKNERRSS